MVRSALEDGIYHVTTRGVADQPIYRDDLDRTLFQRLLGRVAAKFEWDLYASCQLTTHYHLVLETTTARLSAGMKQLNGTYAAGFNQRYERRGHVFGERFSTWLVADEEHLGATIGYVLANPRRAGLCRQAEDWRWLWVAERFAEAAHLPQRRT
jgi:REP element-mobilizing transposase RayT